MLGGGGEAPQRPRAHHGGQPEEDRGKATEDGKWDWKKIELKEKEKFWRMKITS